MINSNEDMGKRIGYLRDVKFGRMHGSKTKCAQELNISTGYWGDIERGRKKIGIDVIQKLATFFDVDCEWLVTGKSYDCKFLVEHYLQDYHEDSAWYTNLVLFVELAVKFRSEKNNKFFRAAVMTLKCKSDLDLMNELRDQFEDPNSTEKLIDILAEKDEGRGIRTKLGRKLRDVIANVVKDLQEVDDNPYINLPSDLPEKNEDNELDEKATIKLLKDRVIELEEENAKLAKQLKSEKAKVTRIKKKLA